MYKISRENIYFSIERNIFFLKDKTSIYSFIKLKLNKQIHKFKFKKISREFNLNFIINNDIKTHKKIWHFE